MFGMFTIHCPIVILFLHFMIHTAWWWLLCAAETCSCYWICYNKSFVSTDNVIIACCRLRLKCDVTDFVFSRKGRVHSNRQGRRFSRLLAAEVCASAVVMLDTPSSEVVKGTGYLLHSSISPSLPLPCVTVFHHVSTGLYKHNGEVTP